MLDAVEHLKHKGKPDDLSYRKATPEEEARCRKAEKSKGYAITSNLIGGAVVTAFSFYFAFSFMESFEYAWLIPVVFIALWIGTTIFRIVDFKKSESYEIAEGELTSWSKTNQRRYANVWCEKDEVYLTRLRFLSVFRPKPGLQLYVVRGYRGEGKKPHYFVISAYPDPLI
ncbi:hypothetical protein SAMN05216413_0998 [Ruminococcaceae bacterium KH2T8]|nr:hypothetical protein SAMN05216413_0998 [Ruminococcaceae bacterium KH2T8]